MNILPIIGVALIAAVLAVTLKPVNPTFSLLLSLAAGIWILYTVLQPAGQVVDAFSSLADVAGIESTIYWPVLKTVGIAAAVRVAGAICKDAGQNAIAVKLEIAGAVAALIVSFPLFERVLTVVTGML